MSTGSFETCPGCQQRGKKVGRETLESLLLPGPAGRLGEGPYRFCATADCEFVYFDATHTSTFSTGELEVVVFQKSRDPDRPVCYCFDHSVREVRAQGAEGGKSPIADSIAKKCKAGLEDCEHNNPQGSCCLGNINRVARGEGEESSRATDCCAVGKADVAGGRGPRPAPVTTHERSRAGPLSSGLAILGALFASACCWLPLLFLGTGATAIGLAGFFEAYRAWFLGASVLFLGFAFYFVYFREPKCAPGDACDLPDPRWRRWNKVGLWVSTTLVLTFATFPNYVGHLFGDDGRGSAGAEQLVASEDRSFRIEGMTCEGCTATIRAAIAGVDGVRAVEVSYARKIATVTFEGGAADDSAVIDAVTATGYRAELLGGALAEGH